MVRIFLKVSGCFCVLLAVAGVILPLLPTTPFLFLATFCFAKSSPELHQRLLDHKIFGPLISNWQNYRCIDRKSKRVAMLSFIVCISFSAFLLKEQWMAIVFLICGASVGLTLLYRVPSCPCGGCEEQ